MGSGSVTSNDYLRYASARGMAYDKASGRISGHSYRETRLNKYLDPKKFDYRECCNSEEHPNTVPVILALDVTGSMGAACNKVAEVLASVTMSLQKKYPDCQFCIMGIGDLECDDAPIQMGQFESDIRIAEDLDRVYMEHGGGGNGYESYTAAWYMGLYHTKLDCFDKQGHKGIIITMGDEPLNPILYKQDLAKFLGKAPEADVHTPQLFEAASKKFNIYHIAVDSPQSSYNWHKEDILKTFPEVIGKNNFKVSSIDSLPQVIEECIIDGNNNQEEEVVVTPPSNSESGSGVKINENGNIYW